MTRQEIVAIVAERMAGSREAAEHTHIECHCEGLVHRKEEYEVGCFCPECASKKAVELGLAATDTEPEEEVTRGGMPMVDDTPQWCKTCERLISTEITADGAEEELAHWEAGGPTDPNGEPCGGPPKNADEWREFMLCVVAIAGEHLPRVERLVVASSIG